MNMLRSLSLAASAALLAPGLLAQAPHSTIVNGTVTVSHGGGAPVALDSTAPLATDDRVRTEAKSKAVIVCDGAGSFELAASTDARVAQAVDGQLRVEVYAGTLTYRVEGPLASAVDIDTPSVTVRPSQIGIYAVTIRATGESEIVPRQGNVEVFAPAGSQWVYAGQKLIARGDRGNPEFRVTSAVSRFTRAMWVLAQAIQVVDIATAIGGSSGGSGGGAAAHHATPTHAAPAAPTPRSTPPSAPSHPSPAPPPIRGK